MSKLYTEEEVRRILSFCDEMTMDEWLKDMTPIELPTDEEIKEEKHFIQPDKIDGEWLSPIPEERKWQREKLVEIFGHYPNASPRWQYLNGLLNISLDKIKGGQGE